MSSETYYHAKWRSHCAYFILAGAILTNAVIWAAVALFYAMPVAAIWLGVLAVFCIFAAVVEFRQCDHYHTLYLRSIINTNTTNQ